VCGGILPKHKGKTCSNECAKAHTRERVKARKKAKSSKGISVPSAPAVPKKDTEGVLQKMDVIIGLLERLLKQGTLIRTDE
jgi:hypothetical protein